MKGKAWRRFERALARAEGQKARLDALRTVDPLGMAEKQPEQGMPDWGATTTDGRLVVRVIKASRLG